MDASRNPATTPRAEAPAAPRRVTAVIPCFNRPDDLQLLLGDLERQAERAEADLRVLVVDNASTPPLAPAAAGLDLRVLRLEGNVGGSGGFNAGMAMALRSCWPGFIWLLDSDARVEPGALAGLLTAMEQPEVAVAGSGLAHPQAGIGAGADPRSGPESDEVFELGGFVDRRTGELIQPLPPGPGEAAPPAGAAAPAREVDYVAACSMLVRREAIEASGLMADLFVSGDDAEWCLRIAHRTGGRIVAVPGSIARHPDPDKMRTWARYDVARNCLVACEALGLGPAVRARRVMREVARALAQNLVGADDLAELHLRGLEDLAAGNIGAAARAQRITFERPRPLAELPRAVERLRDREGEPARSPELRRLPATARQALTLAGVDVEAGPAATQARDVAPLVVHLIGGPQSAAAIVSARARPGDWLLGRQMILVAEGGFVERRLTWLGPLGACACTLWRGGRAGLRLALRGPGAAPVVPPAPLGGEQTPTVSLSIVILSYNRRDALLATLTRLRDGRHTRAAEIIVVDNASSDGSAAAAGEQFPGVRIIEMGANAGVAGFNRGAEAATGDAILILDDDAWPDDDALGRALALLEARPDVGAVSLLPRHPQTLRPEWPFARVLAAAARDDWPVMGCGNLVRREAWQAVGGYEEGFFLYRNDVDLALKLLSAAWRVWFDPTWVVWHDSPAAARKSLRWFEGATRNWIWLARRHGRGGAKWGGIVLGWANAHRLAGGSARAHAAVLRGAWQGLRRQPPGYEGSSGDAWRRLLGARRHRPSGR